MLQPAQAFAAAVAAVQLLDYHRCTVFKPDGAADGATRALVQSAQNPVAFRDTHGLMSPANM